MARPIETDPKREVGWGPTKSLEPGINTERLGRGLLWATFASTASLFVWMALELDVFAAGAPTDWVVSAPILGLSLPSWIVLAYLRRASALKAFGVLVATVLILSLVPWHPRHAFVNTLHSIEVGTSKEEVFEIMSPYLDKTPWLNAPREVVREKGSTLSFRWCDSGWRHNADMGLVYLQDEKVTGVDFWGD